MMDSTPSFVELSIISFMAGIKISHPSRPKRFSDENFFAKNASNLEIYNEFLIFECKNVRELINTR